MGCQFLSKSKIKHTITGEQVFAYIKCNYNLMILNKWRLIFVIFGYANQDLSRKSKS